MKGGALSHDDGIVSTRPRRNIGKSSGACGEMVSPADVRASRDFNGLICPAPAEALSERKRQFSELSSPRRFAFRVALLHAPLAEEELRADPVEVLRLRCHSRAKLWHDDEIDLHSAVDELQHAAEATGLIDDIGQDAAHGLMAAAAAPVR